MGRWFWKVKCAACVITNIPIDMLILATVDMYGNYDVVDNVLAKTDKPNNCLSNIEFW